MATCSRRDSAISHHARPVRILGGAATALGLVQALTLGCSLLRVRIGQPVGVGIIATAVAVGCAYGFWLGRRAEGALPSSAGRDLPRTLAVAFAAGAALIYASLWCIAWLKPDFTFDGNVYHLPPIHFWAERGYVHWVAAPRLYLHDWADGIWNGIPKAGETAAFVLAQATGAPGLVDALNLPFLLLAAPSVYVLCRAAGARPCASTLAAALFLFVPVNIVQGPTTFVDSAAASANIASLAFTVLAWDAIAAGRMPWRLAPGFGCALGLVIGLKGSGPLLASAEVGLLLCGAALGSGSRRRLVLRCGAYVAVLLCVAVAVGGYWTVRNTIRHGNPLYPIGVTVAGITLAEGYSPEEFVGGSNPGVKPGTEEWSDARQLANAWAQGLRAWPRSIVFIYTAEGGLGYLWLLGCVPAGTALAVLAARRRSLWSCPEASDESPDSAERLLLLSALVGALFIATPAHHIARYTLWLYGLGLPVFARAAQAVWFSRRPAVRSAGRAWVLVCVLLLAFEACYSLAWTATRTRKWDESWPAFREHPLRAASSLWWYDRVGYNWPQLAGTVFEELLRGEGAVAVGPMASPRWVVLGQICQPPGRRPLRFLSPAMAASREETAAFLRDHDIRYVVWDVWRHTPGFLPEFALREERIGEWFCVYTIDLESAAAATPPAPA